MKNFIWLSMVWVLKIVLAPRTIKVPFFKGLYFNIFGGFTSNQVALYDLNKKNRNKYLSEFDWYKSRKINGENAKLLNNKVKFNNLISEYANVPKIYFIKEKTIYNLKNKEIDINDAINIIKKNSSVFLKPISKGKGNDVNRIDYKNKFFYLNLKKVKENEIVKLLKKKKNYFVSEAIRQADYLNEVFADSTNTIRIISVRDENEIKILYAVQRFGDKNSIPVDNGSKGGIVSKIDLNTGKLSVAKSIKRKKSYISHPDTGVKIKGIIIPDFNSIKLKVTEIMKNLPDIKFIAWDLLVSNKGIYVIEANASSGVNIIQVFGGQRNKALGKFYKKNNIIK